MHDFKFKSKYISQVWVVIRNKKLLKFGYLKKIIKIWLFLLYEWKLEGKKMTNTNIGDGMLYTITFVYMIVAICLFPQFIT